MKRLFDIILSFSAGLLSGPIVLCGVIAVKLSSPGPAFFRASRAGLNGHPFVMWKLRTMHCRPQAGSSITGAHDSRVFAAGRVLRKLKIDELPQLWNILIGDMSVVGPRPEAPDIVENHYTPEYYETLLVRPGLTSPGSLYYYTDGEALLETHDGDPEQLYVDILLPAKMDIERRYLQRCNVLTDAVVVLKTAGVLFGKVLGRNNDRSVKPTTIDATTTVSSAPQSHSKAA